MIYVRTLGVYTPLLFRGSRSGSMSEIYELFFFKGKPWSKWSNCFRWRLRHEKQTPSAQMTNKFSCPGMLFFLNLEVGLWNQSLRWNIRSTCTCIVNIWISLYLFEPFSELKIFIEFYKLMKKMEFLSFRYVILA